MLVELQQYFGWVERSIVVKNKWARDIKPGSGG